MKKRRLEEEPIATKAPRCSILENVAISEKYLATDYSKKFKETIKSAKPFPHISLRNFIDNSSNFVEQLETELQEFPNWRRKENDLYSLYQTTDFKNIPSTSQPNFFAFREFLSNVVKPWLEMVSGVNLTDQIDITGSCYSETDNLLPHNDQIETRRFAFVYYLTEVGWSKIDGGALYLFNSDEQCMPTMINAELLPYRNSFLLFEVTQRSWHQVAEILQGDRPRLSINGWFHSTRRLKEVVPPTEIIPRFLPVDLKVNQLNEFASLIYTENEKLKQINVLFEEESQVLLPAFFKPVSFKKITEALKKEQFQLCGPPNKRRIFRLKKEAKAKNELGHFSGWLRSNYARAFFEKVTGCQLKGLHSSVEVSRVDRGCYTVMGDEDAAKSKEDGYILEIHFFFGDLIDFPADVGGSIYYVAKDDEEELMRINPQMNSAAIVFKEADVFSFVKYVTHKIPDNFYIVSLRYYNVEGSEESVT